MTFDHTSCLDCVNSQPPDAILSIPPPPLPSFLLPKSSDLLLPGNNHSSPCFAANMCGPSLSGGQSDHIEFIELPRNANIGIDEPWFFVLICIVCALLFIGTIFAIILLKCRDRNCSYHDANLKHQMQFSRERDANGNNKALASYPTVNGQTLMPAYNPPLPVLWATLTPNGTTQHYIGQEQQYPQEDHYEAVDYNRKAYQACVNDLNKSFSTPKKNLTINPNKGQFENNGFIDFEDYADPAPLLVAGSFSNLDSEEIDSGLGEYQDPHQFSNGSSNGEFYPSSNSLNSNLHYRSSPASSTLSRQQRSIISTPTRIANPNVVLPALNSRTLAKNIKNATMNHHSSPVYNKRISTTLNHRRSGEKDYYNM